MGGQLAGPSQAYLRRLLGGPTPPGLQPAPAHATHPSRCCARPGRQSPALPGRARGQCRCRRQRTRRQRLPLMRGPRMPWHLTRSCPGCAGLRNGEGSRERRAEGVRRGDSSDCQPGDGDAKWALALGWPWHPQPTHGPRACSCPAHSPAPAPARAQFPEAYAPGMPTCGAALLWVELAGMHCAVGHRCHEILAIA
jgi:hypothetical protein